ncbi:hypothetical protein DM02DRAFT_717298 [Periconia macrospinosa]|uniref:catechol O-methyltransferase n=1 Tax=Periconia macrospinosa TaxID=97972 RepID=A0A2V1DW88_9PLEO|nr:hypothetical protein DM02DRAFT_717298 [Periconia macrospinosa]
MSGFNQEKAYAPKEDTFFDDGREVELLHFVYSHHNINKIRGSPKDVLAAIDEFGRTKKYLMNVGEDKGRIVTELIAEVKPKTMVELGGYVGYSCILFGDAVRRAGGQRYFSLERNPEFAAVILSLVDLAGLSDVVKVVVGSSDESIARLHSTGLLEHIDLIFLDHYKPAYTTDLKLCEEFRLVTPGSVLAADNVIKPGNPPYLEYVRSTVEQKRINLKEGKTGGSVEAMAERTVKQYANKYAEEKFSHSPGNPNLVYDSKLVNSYEPTGIPPSTPRSISTPLWYRHVPKNLLLILLSIITLPISITVVLVTLLHDFFKNNYGNQEHEDENLNQKTILVTGVSMTKGLTILRLLSAHTPHRIIGADVSAVSPGRFSNSLSKFYRLKPPLGDEAEPYIDSLLSVIQRGEVDLWISCSSVVAAVEDGVVVRLAEERAKAAGREFKAVQFREDVVEKLHEKDQFIEYVKELGLKVPESWRCTSRREVLDVLLDGEKGKDEEPDAFEKEADAEGGGKRARQYLLKPIGVDDKARAAMMTLLPFVSSSDTRSHVNDLSITPQNPFQLQEFISGAEYCTHALIIRGRVAAFTACPSSELLMHYSALPPSSPLTQAMLDFTKRVAEKEGEDFTGHLSFDFLVPPNGGAGDTDQNPVIYPIECNPRAHTATVLFANTPDLSSAYLSAFPPSFALSVREIVTPSIPSSPYYWVGHDLVTMLILPFLDAAWGISPVEDVMRGWAGFWEHVVGWRDGTFSVADPIPFLALYHLYWPSVFLEALWKRKEWSRINVSTTKVFDT